jgi:hypothetical protein
MAGVSAPGELQRKIAEEPQRNRSGSAGENFECLIHTQAGAVGQGELTPQNALLTTCCAYAVLTPLIGGGVAEWLKAAVC